MSPQDKIAKILGVDKKDFDVFVKTISANCGREGVVEKIVAENERIIKETLEKIHTNPKSNTAAHIRGDLQKTIFYQEKQFLEFLKNAEGQDEFEKAAKLAKSLAKIGRGFFLKKSLIPEIFKKCNPDNLLKYLSVSADELIKREDLTEAFSTLRFVESEEWMHKMFEDVYSSFGPADFEEREIEVKVLGSQWHDIAKKFVEKKHHNVSHLKEFGIIFLNPIKMDIPGKFLRDFALLLHYFHEVEFYSKLFKSSFSRADFNSYFKALVRGDVKDVVSANQKNAWLIVQRYLTKENSQDPRLLQPRVNPESIHWAKGEKDLSGLHNFSGGSVDLGMWFNLDWVGDFFPGDDGTLELISFDLEDNAMSLVSFMEGKKEFLAYHQREAMWTKIFAEYAGGEEKLEKLIVESFDKGFIIL